MDCSGSSKLWQEVLWGETMKWCIRGVIPSDHTAGRSLCLLPGVWIWKDNYERTTYGNPGEGWQELGLHEQKWRRRGMERFRVRPGGGVDWHVKWKRKNRLITVFGTWTTRWPEADFERWGKLRDTCLGESSKSSWVCEPWAAHYTSHCRWCRAGAHVSGEEVKAGNIQLGRSLGQIVEKMRVDGEVRGVRTSTRPSNILYTRQRQKWRPAEESVSGGEKSCWILLKSQMC